MRSLWLSSPCTWGLTEWLMGFPHEWTEFPMYVGINR